MWLHVKQERIALSYSTLGQKPILFLELSTETTIWNNHHVISFIHFSVEVDNALWLKQTCIHINQNLSLIIIYAVSLFQYETCLSDSIKFICFVPLASIWIHVSAWLNCLQIFEKERSQFPLKILYQAKTMLWTVLFAGNF